MKRLGLGYGITQQGSKLNAFDFSKYYNINENSNLSIETYVEGNNDVIHPSLLYFENGWNGYKYWLAFTAFPLEDSQFENPSIVASNDFVNWIIPPGLINPIANTPAVGYNADVHIFMSSDNITMYCIWRERGASNYIRMLKSTDGINWGAMNTIIQLETMDCASPCVVYDAGVYKLFSADLDASPNTFHLYESVNPEIGWAYKQQLQFPPTDTGKEIWHFEIKKYRGNFIMLFSDTNINQTTFGNLFFSQTKDYTKWTNKYVLDNNIGINRFYKSTFILNDNRDGFKLVAGVNYNAFRIVDFYLKENPLNEELNNRVQSASSQSSVAWDSFNRPDGEIGVSTSQHTWEKTYGTFIVENNVVRAETATNNVALLNVGVSDYEAEIEIDKASYQTWFIFRCVNKNNLLRVGMSVKGTVFLQKILSGVLSNISGVNGLIKDKSILKVICSGTSVILYVNQNKIGEIVDSDFNNTGTRIGIQTDNTVSKFNNLIVSAI